MSLAGLAGFAQGFAGVRQDQKDRAERDANAKRQDAYISAMGAYQGGQPIPGAMGAMPDQGGMGQAPNPVDGRASSGLWGLVDAKEGGGRYDTLFGHSQNGGKFSGVDVSKMTLDQLAQFSDPSGEYGQWVKGQVGRVATPMGRWQIVGTTMRNTAAKMGLPGNTVFSPEVQEMMANQLARNRLAAGKTPAAKRAQLRAEWEGFKSVSDSALDAAIAQFESGGGVMQPRPMGATGPF